MTYLYLDDEIDSSLRSFIRRVAPEGGELTIVPSHPGSFAGQIETAMHGEYDGLILDLRLDKVTNDGIQADYRAPTLAQEIRTRAAEALHDEESEKLHEEGGEGDEAKGRSEFPIVLWSTEPRLRQSYDRDKTSHDLFDLICDKDDMVSLDPAVPEEEKAPMVGVRLQSLVVGYKAIQALRDETGDDERFYRFLGLESPPEFLDERLADFALSEVSPQERPAHEYARFVRRQVLESEGPLVDRRTVAARLGIDMATSADFDELLLRFESGVYGGVFHEGWPRWWAEEVEELAEDLIDDDLRSLSASERVERLSKATGFGGLRAAEPISDGDSDAFWVVCQATDRPLDPRDGYVMEAGRRYPWQRDKYVSRYAVENRMLRRRHLRLTVSERERAAALFS